MPESPSLYIRGVQRTMEGITYALERRLPAKGSVYAKLGDIVKPETVVAEGKMSAGFRMFRLGDLLEVPANKTGRYLRRTIGSRIYQGDIIAEATKMFGLSSVQFLAPIDCLLQDFNPQTGQLTVQYAPVSYRLPAGVRGKVSQILPDEGVIIETQVSMLFGTYTSGKFREGALHLVAPPDQPISPQVIDAKLSGHIIAGGSMVTKDVISRALAVGVKGIITGGIAAHDLLEISGGFNTQEDVGVTILITSGLGNSPMEQETYDFLQKYNEQQVYIVPKDKMMVAPLPVGSDVAAHDISEVPHGYLPLNVGASVRLLTSPNRGEVAKVVKVLPAKQPDSSRIPVPFCLLERSGGDTIEIPVTNLELIAG